MILRLNFFERTKQKHIALSFLIIITIIISSHVWMTFFKNFMKSMCKKQQHKLDYGLHKNTYIMYIKVPKVFLKKLMLVQITNSWLIHNKNNQVLMHWYQTFFYYIFY